LARAGIDWELFAAQRARFGALEHLDLSMVARRARA
jgi:hypothetical protein